MLQQQACAMALHRDIHWIGRQWAVTGHGMQAVDQRHGGHYDIEIERLYDETLIAWLREQPWFNAADFDKGLAIARRRYPEPPRAEEPPAQPEPEPAVEAEPEVASAEPEPLPEPIAAAPPLVEADDVVEPSTTVLEMADPEPPIAEPIAPAKAEAPEDLLNKWFERYGLDQSAPAKRPDELPTEVASPAPVPAASIPAEPSANTARPGPAELIEPSQPVLPSPEAEPPAAAIQMPITTRAKFVRPWRVPIQAIKSYRL